MTQHSRLQRSSLDALLVCGVACSVILAGCFKTSDVLSNGHSALDHDGGPGPAGPDGSAENGPPGPDDSVGSATAGPDGSVGSSPQRAPLDPAACMNGGYCAKIFVDSVDKVDLLLMVGNTGSMSAAQALLSAQFPRLIDRLTSGDRDGDGIVDGPAARDLHLGVVSSDLGVTGIDGIDHCDGLGDDGLMQHEPRTSGCAASYPRFLSFNREIDSAASIANDLSCIATLGNQGCSIAQPLESSLKALWPAADSRVTFLADPNGASATGHGDNDNGGFLRADLVNGPAVTAIVMLTDEEDCSSTNTSHLTPRENLNPSEPADVELLGQGMGVRCNFHQDNLYILSRYVHAFQALEPSGAGRVVFAAITGVPPQTVDSAALSATNFADPASREQFYGRIEDDDAMQPVVDDHGTRDVADDTMRPACTSTAGSAAPARRIVEVAKGMGENGLVQSICADDYGPAIDAIAERITDNLGAECLTSPLVRNGGGEVDCDLIWELQPPGAGGPGAPIECGDLDFLLPLAAGAMQHTADGGARCRLPQLPITSTGGTPTPGTAHIDGHTLSEGWYYDDFSADAKRDCREPGGHRIAFTPDAKPPSNVGIVLDCKPAAGTN